MIATVFLGPTMSLEDARAILPNARYRPPAAQGDLLAAVDQDHAGVIGLIDGTFHHTLSVWHSEVCYLLNRGVAIFGASSMGALRAAETEIYGTRGVGTIFGWYRDGVIMADDEVALVHGNEENGYLPMSLPLVNIRASLAHAVSGGRFDARHAEQVIDVARSLYYPDRQVWSILQSCKDHLVPEHVLSEIERALTEDYVDLKRDDAREMLTLMKDVMDGSIQAPARVDFDFSRSSVFETLYNLDRRVQVGNTEVSLQAIREHAALHDPRLERVQRAALDRSIVVIFGTLLGLRVTKDDLARTRAEFLDEHEITSDLELHDWLRKNAMCEADLTEYLIGEALCTRLRKWMMNSRGLDRSCRAVLDEARDQGLFPAWAESTAEMQRLVTTFRDQPEYQQSPHEDFRRVAALHYQNTLVPIRGDVRERAETLGFDDVADMVDALGQSAIYHDVKARIERQLRALERAEQLLGDAPL